MITAGDFKKGITIEWDGGVWNIVDFQHVKPGKGAAFVRTKIKNVMTGAVVERSFNPTDKMPKAIIETKEMQYVYNDGDLYYFMDVETYEQLPLSKDQVEDAIPFVKEGTNVPTPISPLRWRPASACRCRCSSTPATRSRSTPAAANTSSAPDAQPGGNSATAGRNVTTGTIQYGGYS